MVEEKMRKKLAALGIILFIVGVLIVVIPEQTKIHVQVLPFSMTGIMIGIVGIILAAIGLGSILAERP